MTRLDTRMSALGPGPDFGGHRLAELSRLPSAQNCDQAVQSGTSTVQQGGDLRLLNKTASAQGSRQPVMRPISGGSLAEALFGLDVNDTSSRARDARATATQVFLNSPLSQRNGAVDAIGAGGGADPAFVIRNTYQDGWDFLKITKDIIGFSPNMVAQPAKVAALLKAHGIDSNSAEFMRGFKAATADAKSKEPPGFLVFMNDLSAILGLLGDLRVGGGARRGGGIVTRPTMTNNRPVPTPKRVTPGEQPKTVRSPATVPTPKTPAKQAAGVPTRTKLLPSAEALVQTVTAQLARKDLAGAERSIEALKTLEIVTRRSGQADRANAIRTVRVQLEAQRSALWHQVNEVQSAATRSLPQTKKAFNNPSHWDTSGPLIRPVVVALRGDAAKAWKALTQKFGPELAVKMYDANLRGGLSGVNNLLTAEKSDLTLTVRDLIHLQYVGFSDGVPTVPGQAGLVKPTLHDAVHAVARYGVSGWEELHGDQFAEGLLNDIFTGRQKVKLDPKLSLSEQPQAAKEIAARIDAAYQRVDIKRIVEEIDAVSTGFSSPSSWPKLEAGWEKTASPKTLAERAEKILRRNGALAHLKPADDRAIKEMIYGPKNTKSFEAIAGRLSNGGSKETYNREVAAWVEGVKSELVARTSKMSPAEFKFHAERAVAIGVLLNRTQPGAMALGPFQTSIDSAKLKGDIDKLDLRTTYPQALSDVRKALSATKK